MSLRINKLAEAPSVALWWVDDDGDLIDFSSGYTFTLKLGQRGQAAELTKTTGITGALGTGTEPSGVPNVTVAWSAGELADVTPGLYEFELTARTGSSDRVLEDTIWVTDSVGGTGPAPLASPGDVAVRIGQDFTVDELDRVNALLADASAAVRDYTGRPFAETTTTTRLRARYGVVMLPRRPTSVDSVETYPGAATVGFTWDGLQRVAVGTLNQFDLDVPLEGTFDITYTYGSDTVPDAIKAVVVGMVARAFGTPADQGALQSEQIAGYSYTVGSAAAAGPVGLLPAEKAILDRYTPTASTFFPSRA